jgi:hypothetical protein
MKDITCIDDLRQLACRKVPRAFFEYADSGSYNEETLRASRSGSSFTSSGTAASRRTSSGARRRRNAMRWYSPWICRCSASVTATSRTA